MWSRWRPSRSIRHSARLLSILHYAGIKAQQISARRFRPLNYPVVLPFIDDREGGIFPSISVKIDSGEARKRRLLCGESQPRRQLPTSRTSSCLPSAHRARLPGMFAQHRYAAEASHGGRIFPSIHSNCPGSR